MVMEKSYKGKICPKSWNFVISYGSLPILPSNCTKFTCFFATTEKLSNDVESLYFPMFSNSGVNKSEMCSLEA